MTDLLPVVSTSTVEETLGPHVRRARKFIHRESSGSGKARIDVEWVTSVYYTHPSTWTQEEAAAEFAELLADMARAQSIQLISNLPDAVVPVVLPQLEEIAQYEAQMWQARRELEGPSINERWVALPIIE